MRCGDPSRATLVLVAWLALAAGAGAQPTAPAAPSAVAVSPLPLAEVAVKSDELGQYLQEVAQRLGDVPEVEAIAAALPTTADQVRDRAAATDRALAGSPGLREVEILASAWRGQREELLNWNATLSTRATQLQHELNGLDELRAIWRATRDDARAQDAPTAVRDRIAAILTAITATRKQIEARRARLFELQDRLVAQLSATRAPLDRLAGYRRRDVDRMLEADAPPLWRAATSAAPWREAVGAVLVAVAAEARDAGVYARAQSGRLLLQLGIFALLYAMLRRARGRAAKWVAEDPSLARAARVFDVPAAAALVVALFLTRWLLPEAPPLIYQGAYLLALLPALYLLRQLVDPPLVPALWALVVFYVVDQVGRLLAPAPVLAQILFVVEMSGAALFLAWLVRSGRFRAMWSPESRWAPPAERGARLLMVAFAVAAVAAALGFTRIARYLQDVLVDSSALAVLLFGLLQVLEGLWAALLRTRVARRLRMVTRHRVFVQRRGERVLAWLAVAVWVLGSLVNARLLDPLLAALRAALATPLALGAVTISPGSVLAFAAAVWLTFAVSRFVRFLLDEDVYPRVNLARGVPYALSNLAHYAILLAGLVLALAALGADLSRFVLLAGALGVGIGFGLQNVVNNFVSGLILLFERPIQVGDVVQLANATGEVRRIGIRSSTLRTPEGADVIVPNGDLISSTVINWTLNDRLRRIDVPVGVAYGSDPEQVLALLRAAAGSHPYILDAPKPGAFFVGFGDSALNFELRVWTDRFDLWVATRSELAVTIHAKLGEAGIGIPFPQRDVNVVYGPQPLTVRLFAGGEPPREDGDPGAR